MISDDEVADYREDGYLLVRGALNTEAVERFRGAAAKVLAGQALVGDSYERVLHQVHLPWLADDELAALTRHSDLAAAARSLSGMDGVRVFLDQVISKPPGGVATIAHQDAPFLSFDDHRSVNCWVALERVTKDNGALVYYRGSHRLGPLPRIHLDEADDLLPQVPALAGCGQEMLEMAPGDVVFHNCLTVHRAAANLTDRPRLAFSIQYMATDARYNGYAHDFLAPSTPEPGQVLDLPCFAEPDQAMAPQEKR
jgi:ectoine hydroxylase-related dioxygenase (phytanoyl-CoA dioxygenase family)